MPRPPTTIADAAITASLRQHAEAARGAYAGNTERALRADVAIFTGWCAGEDRQALPASPETVAAFYWRVAAIDLRTCGHCGVGHMYLVRVLPAHHPPARAPPRPDAAPTSAVLSHD